MTRLALTALLIWGCFRIDYLNGGVQAPYPSEELWRHRAAWGIVEFDDPVALDQICPQGFARVHTEVSLVNGLASIGVQMIATIFTAGVGTVVSVYTPSTITVWCQSGTAYDLEIDEQGRVLTASDHSAM